MRYQKKIVAAYALAGILALTFNGCGGGSSGGGSNVDGTNSGNTGNGVSVDALAVVGIDDIKGYTIQSNRASTEGTPYQITLTIGCDGSYTYTDTKVSGSGASIRIEAYENVKMIVWGGQESVDGGYLMLGGDSTLVAGKSCWLDSRSAGSGCSSGLYVESIIQNEVCE